MLLAFDGNSETIVSIPKKKIPRHQGCKMKKAQKLQSKQTWVGRWWVEGVSNPKDLAES